MVLPSKKWCFNTIDDNIKHELCKYLSRLASIPCLLTLTLGIRIYSIVSSPAYLPTFYTSSNFFHPSVSNHVSIVQLIDSFSIYLVHSIFPPSHRCSDYLVKGGEGDYGVCSQEFLRSCLPFPPRSFPWLLKMHLLIWLSLTLRWVPMSIIYLARRYWLLKKCKYS